MIAKIKLEMAIVNKKVSLLTKMLVKRKNVIIMIIITTIIRTELIWS